MLVVKKIVHVDPLGMKRYETIDSKDYEVLHEFMKPEERERFLKDLYFKKQAGTVDVFCNCKSGVDIPLVISHKGGKSFHIKRAPGSGLQHDENCNYHGENTSSKKVWEVDEDGDFHVRIEGASYNLSSKEKKSAEKENAESVPRFFNRREKQPKTTFNGFFRNFTLEAHKILCHSSYRRGKGMTINSMFWFLENIIASKVYLKKSLRIEDVMIKRYSNPEAVKKFIYKLYKENLNVFITGIYLSHTYSREYDDYLVTIYHPSSKKTPYTIRCSSLMFNEALAMNLVQNGPFLVGGFITHEDYDEPPVFVDFAIMPISNSGLFVESSYERKCFNAFLKDKKHFYKPNQSKKSWNGMKPDLIIRGNRNKNIIFECYGRSESDFAYHDKKNLKRKIFGNKEYQYYVEWQAYAGQSLKEVICILNQYT